MDGPSPLWHSRAVARDPRYRPFRIALWVVYLLVVGVSSGLAIRSIVKNLRGTTRPTAQGTLPTRAALRVCVTELEALDRELNERAGHVAIEEGEGDAVHRWQIWSSEWEQRVRDLAERCHLDAEDATPDPYGGREELAHARDAVLEAHHVYSALVTRFAQQQADAVRAAHTALQQARAALARPPERR